MLPFFCFAVSKSNNFFVLLGSTNMGNWKKKERAGSQARQFFGTIRYGRTGSRKQGQRERIHFVVSGNIPETSVNFHCLNVDHLIILVESFCFNKQFVHYARWCFKEPISFFLNSILYRLRGRSSIFGINLYLQFFNTKNSQPGSQAELNAQ